MHAPAVRKRKPVRSKWRWFALMDQRPRSHTFTSTRAAAWNPSAKKQRRNAEGDAERASLIFHQWRKCIDLCHSVSFLSSSPCSASHLLLATVCNKLSNGEKSVFTFLLLLIIVRKCYKLAGVRCSVQCAVLIIFVLCLLVLNKLLQFKALTWSRFLFVVVVFTIFFVWSAVTCLTISRTKRPHYL